MKQGLWCIEGCTTACHSSDIKTLTWNQVFGSWKIVQLSDSSLTSKPWRKIRSLVHGRSYNSRTATWHQNPGLKPGLWCTEDCITVCQSPDIKTREWSQVFGAWKIVQHIGIGRRDGGGGAPITYPLPPPPPPPNNPHSFSFNFYVKHENSQMYQVEG